MKPILIYYYDVIDDYVFCESFEDGYKLFHEFYYFNDYDASKFWTYCSPRMQFICEVT